MNDPRSFRIIQIVIVLISIFLIIIESLGFQFQVFVWEFLIDPKCIFLLLLLVFQIGKNRYYFSSFIDDIRHFQWKTSFVWLIMPLFFLGTIIIWGRIVSQIEYHNVENWPTKLLQILFDFPAFVFFSLSTIFIEEMFFRSLLLKMFMANVGMGKSVLLSSLYWLFFNLSGLLLLTPITILNSLVYILFYLSTGIFLGIVAMKYGQMLYGYLFRVGFLLLSAILLSNANEDQNTFFIAKSVIFSSQGIVFSIFSITFAFIANKRIRYNGIKTIDFEHFP